MSLLPPLLAGMLRAPVDVGTTPASSAVPARSTAAAPTPAPAPLDPLHAKLRQAADGLNGMFIRQLFSAMRATVPEGSDGLGSAGGSMFTQMLDETIADQAATQMRNGLGDAIYRELCGRLTSAGGTGDTSPALTTVGPNGATDDLTAALTTANLAGTPTAGAVRIGRPTTGGSGH